MAYRKRAKSRSNSTKTLLSERDGKKSASSRSHHKKKTHHRRKSNKGTLASWFMID